MKSCLSDAPVERPPQGPGLVIIAASDLPDTRRHEGVCRGTIERDVQHLINDERAAVGVRRIRSSRTLTASARAWSALMAKHQTIAHVINGIEALPAFARYGYPRHAGIGQNCAGGQVTPAEVVAGWMASPGHRSTMLNPLYDACGVGYVDAGDDGAWHRYWTLNVGSVADGVAPPCAEVAP